MQATQQQQMYTLVRPSDTAEPRGILELTPNNNNGGTTNDSVTFSRPPPPKVAAAAESPVARPPRFQPAPPPPSPPFVPPRPEELNDFANPMKLDADDCDGGRGYPDDDDDDEAAYSPEYHHDNDRDHHDNDHNGRRQDTVVKPLPPFETLEAERADLMFKLQRAARSGASVHTFGWNADIREMRAEAARIRAEQEVTTSVAFQRQVLMTICTGLEFANKKYPYFDLELDGWSSSMMDDIGKFDGVFEKLHQKHAGKINVPPELQLIGMIAGSALTWHLIASKRRPPPAVDNNNNRRGKSRRRRRSDDYSDSDSDSDSDGSELSPRTRERRKYMAPAKKPKKPKKLKKRQRPTSEPQPLTQTREMRGPGFDVGGIMGALPQVPVPRFAPPRSTRDTDHPQKPVSDDGSDGLYDDDGSDFQQQQRRADDDVSPGSSERLSDIPSDLEDIPEFDDDDGDGDNDGGDTKTIAVAEEPKKKRARNSKAKNVIVI